MKIIITTFIITALFLFSSCGKNDDKKIVECIKLENRDEADKLKSEVLQNRITDSLSIVNNLIGEWKLIGVFSAWVEHEVGQDCISLTIDSKTIELNDSDSDELTLLNWTLIPFETRGDIFYSIQSDEDAFFNRVGMEVFSDSIMYGSARTDDGATYFYQKF